MRFKRLNLLKLIMKLGLVVGVGLGNVALDDLELGLEKAEEIEGRGIP